MFVRSRAVRGFTLLDVLLAALLVAIGAVAVAAPLARSLSVIDGAARMRRRTDLLADAAARLAARAREGDCTAGPVADSALDGMRSFSPAGLRVQLRTRARTSAERTDTLDLLIPCVPAATP